MKRSFFVIALILLLISPITKSRAADLPEYRFVLSPYAGAHLFGSHRNFDDAAELGLRLEKDLTRPWSAELGVGILVTENRNGKSRRGLTYALNALYHLPSDDKKIDPFVILGLGGDTLPGSLYGPEIGFGVRYFLRRDLAFRSDARYLFLFEERNDFIATVGLSYFLSWRPPAPTPAVQKPSAPPVPPPVPVPSAPPEPEPDSDHDGVKDSADRCPGTSAGVKVDNRGCPLDTDRDGVPDSIDKCPNTMEGAKVNTEGCVVSITLNIKFDPDRSEIKEEYYPGIERFAIFMGENPSLKVEIQGHTDNVGFPETNLALSEERARAVRDLLIGKFGISPERLSARGYGQNHPITTNETPEGRSQNRRVEAVIK